MRDVVWACVMDMIGPGARSMDADIVINENARAIEGIRRCDNGEPLSPDWFPKEIWANAGSGGRLSAQPDFFYGNGYWVVSVKSAEVMRRFDLGRGALYPVTLRVLAEI